MSTPSEPQLSPQEQAVLDQLAAKAGITLEMDEPFDPNAPALDNYAVARCAAAWTKAHDAATRKSKSEYYAKKAGAKAFREAMPPLYGKENIADFVACVGYAMLIGALETVESSKYLYAAQVASCVSPAATLSPRRA